MRQLYLVYLVHAREDPLWRTDIPCGFFSTKSKARAAIREMIKVSDEDELTKGDFDVYEHNLNTVELHPQGLLVQDLWG